MKKNRIKSTSIKAIIFSIPSFVGIFAKEPLKNAEVSLQINPLEMMHAGIRPPFKINIKFRIESIGLITRKPFWSLTSTWKDPSKKFYYTFPAMLPLNNDGKNSSGVYIRDLNYRISDANGNIIFSSGGNLDLFKRFDGPRLYSLLIGLEPSFLPGGKRTCRSEVYLFSTKY